MKRVQTGQQLRPMHLLRRDGAGEKKQTKTSLAWFHLNTNRNREKRERDRLRQFYPLQVSGSIFKLKLKYTEVSNETYGPSI